MTQVDKRIIEIKELIKNNPSDVKLLKELSLEVENLLIQVATKLLKVG